MSDHRAERKKRARDAFAKSLIWSAKHFSEGEDSDYLPDGDQLLELGVAIREYECELTRAKFDVTDEISKQAHFLSLCFMRASSSPCDSTELENFLFILTNLYEELVEYEQEENSTKRKKEELNDPTPF